MNVHGNWFPTDPLWTDQPETRERRTADTAIPRYASTTQVVMDISRVDEKAAHVKHLVK